MYIDKSAASVCKLEPNATTQGFPLNHLLNLVLKTQGNKDTDTSLETELSVVTCILLIMWQLLVDSDSSVICVIASLHTSGYGLRYFIGLNNGCRKTLNKTGKG